MPNYKNNNKRWNNNKNRNHTGKQAEPEKSATAPYNFVPLNSDVVPSDMVNKNGKIPSFEKYHNDNFFSGHIDLTITTKTPLYIKGEGSDFFSPGGIPKIPGSSIRGMIRRLVAIVSWGKFTDYNGSDDKRLYYRDLRAKHYTGKMIAGSRNNGYFPKVKAGILKKEGREYVIYPSKIEEQTQFYRVDGHFTGKSYTVADAYIKLDHYGFMAVWFKHVKPKPHDDRHRVKLKYALVTKVILPEEEQVPPNGYKKGYLIVSGPFGGRNHGKHMQWIINEADDKKVAVPDDVIKSYRDDVSRKSINLLEKIKDDGVPCFYLTDNGKITAFGHTGMFRLPYDKTIGDHIPPKLKDENITDIPEAIFGKKGEWAGRVYFEDAVVEDNNGLNNIYKDIKLSGLLYSPKPTSYTYYLEQEDNKNVKHWNDGKDDKVVKNDKVVKIRGDKLYWHRTAKLSDGDSKTIKPDVKFNGRVRFENLSKIELGALLFVLDLPDDRCHKIGMAKPLGLGSIEIEPELFIIDRSKRYEKLFDDKNWYLGINPEKPSIEPYKKDFATYILEKMPKNDKGGAKELWKTPRLKILKRMLGWKIAESEN